MNWIVSIVGKMLRNCWKEESLTESKLINAVTGWGMAGRGRVLRS
jgi:hypothetical protein